MNLFNKMKQYALLAAVSMGAINANAQAINESFDNITTLAAAGWVMNNLSTPIGTQASWFQAGATPPFAPFGGTDYIAANYNNVAGAATISNWLITPARTLNNGDVVTFYTRTVDAPQYPDRLEVRLSLNGTSTDVGTTNTSVGDFTTVLLTVNPTLIATGAGSYPNTWTQYSFTVSGLPTPMTGRMAFRYFVTNGGPSGTNSDFIGIDNFVYTPAGSSAPDMDVTAVNGEYTQIPLTQATAMNLGATVANSGTANATNAMITANVFLAPNFTTPVQTTTSSPAAVNMGANTALTAGTFTPSAIGNYVIRYTVSATGDVNAVNDTMVYAFSVTDAAYARDNNTFTGSLGIGAGAAANGILGQNFNMVNNAQVDSVMVFIANGGAGGNTMVGQPVTVSVYSTTAGTPNTSVATSNAVTVTAVGPQWVKLTFATPLTLTTGTYFFGVNEADSNVTVGTSSSIFTAGATWVNWATIPTGTWANSEAFGFNVAYGIRPFVSVPCAITATGSVSSNVSCNGSADGVAMASASGGLGAATYLWSDGQTTASATGLAAGVYTVTATATCSDVASVTITEPTALMPMPDSFALDVACNGDATGYIFVTIMGGTTPYTYLWSNGATTDDLTGLSAGIYSGTATDANGCVTGGVFTVTEPSLLTSSAMDNGDGSATAAGSGGSPSYSYMWDAAAGNQATATATGLMSGTYDVTVTDINGCTSVSSVTVTFTGVDNIATLNTLNMFPNPTNANVFVDLDLTDNQDVAIRITNVTGQTVLEQNIGTIQNQRVELNTSNLSTGVYMVQFFIGSEMTTRKLVVDKR